jgi:hypothetical protein
MRLLTRQRRQAVEDQAFGSIKIGEERRKIPLWRGQVVRIFLCANIRREHSNAHE